MFTTILVTTLLTTPPPAIAVQGRLQNAGGAVDGTYSVTFRLYGAQTGGDPFWEKSDVTIEVVGGHFSAVLEPVGPELFTAPGDAWFGVTVQGEPELPRQKLQSVPMSLVAVRALSIECSGCITGAAFAPDAISAELLPSVPWDKLTGVPDTLLDGDDVGIDGAGVAGRLALFSEETVVGASSVYEVDGKIGIGGVPTGDAALQVVGAIDSSSNDVSGLFGGANGGVYIPIVANNGAGTGDQICAKFGMRCQTKMLNNAGCLASSSCHPTWSDCTAVCNDNNGVTEHSFDCIVMCYP